MIKDRFTETEKSIINKMIESGFSDDAIEKEINKLRGNTTPTPVNTPQTTPETRPSMVTKENRQPSANDGEVGASGGGGILSKIANLGVEIKDRFVENVSDAKEDVKSIGELEGISPFAAPAAGFSAGGNIAGAIVSPASVIGEKAFMGALKFAGNTIEDTAAIVDALVTNRNLSESKQEIEKLKQSGAVNAGQLIEAVKEQYNELPEGVKSYFSSDVIKNIFSGVGDIAETGIGYGTTKAPKVIKDVASEAIDTATVQATKLASPAKQVESILKSQDTTQHFEEQAKILGERLIEATDAAADKAAKANEFLPAAEAIVKFLPKKIKSYKDINSLFTGLQNGFVNKVQHKIDQLVETARERGEGYMRDTDVRLNAEGKLDISAPTVTEDMSDIITADEILKPAEEAFSKVASTIGIDATSARKTYEKVLEQARKDIGDGISISTAQTQKKNFNKFLSDFFPKADTLSTLDNSTKQAYNKIRAGLMEAIERKADSLEPGAGAKIKEWNADWKGLEEAREYIAPILKRQRHLPDKSFIEKFGSAITSLVAGQLISASFGKYSAARDVLRIMLKEDPNVRLKMIMKHLNKMKEKAAKQGKRTQKREDAFKVSIPEDN